MKQARRALVTWGMAAVLVCAASAALGAEIHLVAKPPKLNGGATSSPAASPAPSASPAASPAVQPSPAPSATPQATAPGASAVRSPAAGQAVSAADATGSSAVADPTLVALGSLGASNLYFSYLTLGTVADGFVGGSYTPQVAISVANESIFMNSTARANLDRMLGVSSLAQEDKEVLAYMIATYDVLINQAKALVQFITNQKDDGSQYQKYRTEAWKRIVQLFGIS